ncbi:GNAT family N-acetyltransferase [Lysinibacillus sp. 2017]|uniref:GNAT family N-acetyltransferase n=1 Tax=unclassified Lysinibacillus TaxID=2636778 RepID=UPI000D529ABD|nr:MULTISPECIES: GNAT family N-acetyltransferase [unclassified Lysinibacillus]AWE07162.1 GNAT family N-acetyltransferase [Lysinibacillus sp. 2017]TGN36918.1 GNAT family N-acetyltransferase [Lysinibacillus sp. S2017]
MEIRSATLQDAAGIAKVHVDSWRTTYRGIIPQNFLDNLSYEQRTKLWQKNIADSNGAIFVAVNNANEIIGFVVGEKRETNLELNASDLSAIYLLEQWQGNGVGRLLLNAVMQSFKEKGFQKIYVEVLAENKTRHFYEYYGAEYVKTVQLKFDGKVVDEDIYVWNDIDAVLSKLQ